MDTLRTENETLKQQLKEMEEKIKLMTSSKPKKIKKSNLTEEQLLELEFENKFK
jgi:cell division septum initiation protein DivIVA